MGGAKDVGEEAGEGGVWPAPSERFRVYTKTGDGGDASLYNGERQPKDAAVFHALGDVDELNSAVGVARQAVRDVLERCAAGPPADREEAAGPWRMDEASRETLARLGRRLAGVQSRLLDVGSAIATPLVEGDERDVSGKAARARFILSSGRLARLERFMDEMDDLLPPLSSFILPSGGFASCFLHVARATCRRAERACVPLSRDGRLEESCSVYLNRLSDLLFVAARFCAQCEGEPEVCYRKARGPGAQDAETDESGEDE